MVVSRGRRAHPPNAFAKRQARNHESIHGLTGSSIVERSRASLRIFALVGSWGIPLYVSVQVEITARRETTQPIREKTGGSTFKNPPGHSSWKLVDEAGWRGKPYGGAMFSTLHSNFMISTGEATAADLEGLGDAVRADVRAKTGIDLHWEIKRIGRPA